MKLDPIALPLLNYTNDLDIRTTEGKLSVWDPCRRKEVALEPEEFVRQLLIQYFHHGLGIGYGRMVVERQLKNYQGNRFDFGIVHTSGNYSLLAECKSFNHKIDDDAMIQLIKYDASVSAKFLLLSNGKKTFIWNRQNPQNTITDLDQLRDQL